MDPLPARSGQWVVADQYAHWIDLLLDLPEPGEVRLAEDVPQCPLGPQHAAATPWWPTSRLARRCPRQRDYLPAIGIEHELRLSPCTVQDHLRVSFEKVGVSSRRELASRIFFSKYAGRLGSTLQTDGWFNG
ncbi:hypothetical protein OHA70_04715 [Kribbella sp. NBC_00382]|uniref:hypothetical protein n=1 Tax=Kribbella sp. NBC_00382 TaxID=2975967 RepID=UPI002E1A1EE9